MTKITLMLNALLVGNFLFTITSINGMELTKYKPVSLDQLVLRYKVAHLNKNNYKELQPILVRLIRDHNNTNIVIRSKKKKYKTTIGCFLLERAIEHDDAELTNVLLDHNVQKHSLLDIKIKSLLNGKINSHKTKNDNKTNDLPKTLNFTLLAQLAKDRPFVVDFTWIDIVNKLDNTNYENLLPTTLTLLRTYPNINLFTLITKDNISIANGTLLLEIATNQNDTKLIKILLKRSVNPNSLSSMRMPILFHAKELSIAQLLLKHKANLHAIKCDKTNVLREALKHTHSVELLNYYIEQGVDGTSRSSIDGSCIFHELVFLYQTCPEEQQNNFIAKANLLLSKFPNMLNCTITKVISACKPYKVKVKYGKYEREITIHECKILQEDGTIIRTDECNNTSVMQTPLNILQKIMIHAKIHSDNANKNRFKKCRALTKNQPLEIAHKLHALYKKHGAVCCSNHTDKLPTTVQQSDVH